MLLKFLIQTGITIEEVDSLEIFPNSEFVVDNDSLLKKENKTFKRTI